MAKKYGDLKAPKDMELEDELDMDMSEDMDMMDEPMDDVSEMDAAYEDMIAELEAAGYVVSKPEDEEDEASEEDLDLDA